MLNLTFTGNLGADVVLREVVVRGETVKVASFSVAINNGKDTPPTWVKVTVWRKTAEACASFLKKGSHVMVFADNVKLNSWQAQDGTTRTDLEVSARRVEFSPRNRPTSESEPAYAVASDPIPF